MAVAPAAAVAAVPTDMEELLELTLEFDNDAMIAKVINEGYRTLAFLVKRDKK